VKRGLRRFPGGEAALDARVGELGRLVCAWEYRRNDVAVIIAAIGPPLQLRGDVAAMKAVAVSQRSGRR